MCGIAGIYIRKPQNLGHVDFTLAAKELLFSIDSRGGDACGYVALDMEGTMQEQKAACNALDFEKEMRDMPANMRTLLMHTRFATQGSKAFPENNHPVRSGKIRVIHNGHISNDRDFFGNVGDPLRNGRVDSEAIAAAINKAGWDNVKDALEKLDGTFAIAAIDEDHPDELLLAKGDSSPLVVAIRPSFIMWASTSTALTYTWKATVGTAPNSKNLEFLTSGDMLRITPDDVKRESFTVKRRTYTGRGASSGGRYGGGYMGWSGYDDWSDDDTSAGKYTYWMNGRKIEYDRSTGTERVIEESAGGTTTTTRQVDPKTNPLRSWLNNTLGRKELTEGEDRHYCVECGDRTQSHLQDVSGTWYCNECLDFLTDMAVQDAMPGEVCSIYDREVDGAIGETKTRHLSLVESTSKNDYVRCPDCFDYYGIADLIEDKGELICADCATKALIARDYDREA